MTSQASVPDIDAAPDLTPVSLGQRVTFTWILKRYTEHRPIDGDRYGRTSRWKVWRNQSYPGMPEPAPQHGIVIGVRHLANGRADFEYEAGAVWNPREAERLVAYLVAFDLRRKPVLVLPEHLTIDSVEASEGRAHG